ncbi:MAG: hypothetical protein JNK02_12415 [Planctomycetes bacterium]|nr:hypothetical protein [Planctomycetota bacterium]
MTHTPTLARRSQIGELLVSEGKLSREELEAALAYREERGLKLGQALVALHLVTQQDLAGALRSQGRVHCLNLTPGILDLEVARLLPEAMARQYAAVPVHRVAGRITVAMEDPAEEYDVDAIAIALGEPVFAVHADVERIQLAITRAWCAPGAGKQAEPPRFTLLRGPLPEHEPEEAAAALVRAALREAVVLGADSFQVESTIRGTELDFRVDGARTPPAVLGADWAPALVQALVAAAGGDPRALHAQGVADVDGSRVALEVAALSSMLGPCARAAIVARSPRATLDDLPLENEERVAAAGWLALRGVLLVAGARGSAAEALSEDLALRAARLGRRVYRLGAAGEPLDAALVHVPRGAAHDTAGDLEAIARLAPDVVETGLLEEPRAFVAALDAARRGLLVLARVEARDAAEAAARCLAASGDRSSAGLLLGALALVDVRLTCAACAAGSSRDCPRCAGRGVDAVRRVAEALDLHGPLREVLERGADAAATRRAARELGYPLLIDRGRELVEAGLASETEWERALRRASGAFA